MYTSPFYLPHSPSEPTCVQSSPEFFCFPCKDLSLLSKPESGALGTGTRSPVRQPSSHRGTEPASRATVHRGSRDLHQTLQIFHQVAVTTRLQQPQLETDATGRKGLVALGVKVPLQEGRWERKLKTVSRGTEFKLPAAYYQRPSHIF